MPVSFLFYDIETTGLNKPFNQVLQFAAIRTDEDFNELERHEIIVKLRPDVIPTPKAAITHRIPIRKTLTEGIPEYEATRKIHRLLNEPGTVSLGYNTLGFDDEFLRFSFYRNLLDPYTHQYANGCCRMDILPMVTMCFLLRPDSLFWPVSDGKISLKLEKLNEFNNLHAGGQAHNAMTDVEVTVALARHLRKDKRMFDFNTGYFNKEEDASRIEKLSPITVGGQNGMRLGIVVDCHFGSEQKYKVPALLIGSHPKTKQKLFLRLDTEKLNETNVENINETTWVIKKKLGEPGFVLPFEDRYTADMVEDRLKIVEGNLCWLGENPELLSSICEHYRNGSYEAVHNIDPDAALYKNGFPPFQEQVYQNFHNATLEEKKKIAMSMQSPLFKQMALRLIYRNFPDELPQGNLQIFLQRILNPLPDKEMVDYRGEKRYGPKDALEEIPKLRKDEIMDSEQLGLLDELETYILDNLGVVEVKSQVHEEKVIYEGLT